MRNDHLLHTADIALSLIHCCASMQQQRISSVGNIMDNCQETKCIPSVHSPTNVVVAFSSEPAEQKKITNDLLGGNAITTSQSHFARTRNNNSIKLAGAQCQQRFKGPRKGTLSQARPIPKELMLSNLKNVFFKLCFRATPKTHNQANKRIAVYTVSKHGYPR